jgi:hypothetical protein
MCCGFSTLECLLHFYPLKLAYCEPNRFIGITQPPSSLPILCVFAVRTGGGKVVERTGIEKGDDGGID